MSEDDEKETVEIPSEEIVGTIVPTQGIREKGRESYAFVIAVVIVVGFLFLLGVPLIPFLQNPSSTSVEASTVDLIKTESSVLSGIVGAIVGYYYRVTQEKAATK